MLEVKITGRKYDALSSSNRKIEMKIACGLFDYGTKPKKLNTKETKGNQVTNRNDRRQRKELQGEYLDSFLKIATLTNFTKTKNVIIFPPIIAYRSEPNSYKTYSYSDTMCGVHKT